MNDNVRAFPGPQPPKTDGSGGSGYDDEMRERIAKLEAILPTLATKADIESVRVDIEKGQKENRAWMLATVLALFVGILSLGNFLAAGLRDSIRSQPTSVQQAPIVIQVPVAETYALPPTQKPKQ